MKKKNENSKIALHLEPKDKFMLRNGTCARVVSKEIRTLSFKDCSADIIYILCNTATKKNIRMFYSWDDEVKMPKKPDPKARLPWLHAKLESWVKKLEIKHAW